MTPLNVLLETGLHDTHETHENKEANNNNNQIIYLEAVHTGTIQLEIIWNLNKTNSRKTTTWNLKCCKGIWKIVRTSAKIPATPLSPVLEL